MILEDALYQAGNMLTRALLKVCTAPLERVRIVLQCQDCHPEIVSGHLERYDGICNTISRILAEEGWSGLWRGNLVELLRVLPSQVATFLVNAHMKSLFPRVTKEQQIWFVLVNLCVSGIVRVVVAIMTFPLQYTRFRLAADVGKKKQFCGIQDCVVKTMDGPQGVYGLFQGSGATVIHTVLCRGVHFGAYSSIRSVLPVFTGSHATSGFAAFTLAAAAAYPFELARAKLQMQADLPHETLKYRNGWHFITTTIERKGVLALYDGFSVRVAHILATTLLTAWGDIASVVLA